MDVASARRAFADLLQKTVAATSKLNAEGQRRLSKVMQLLAADTTSPDLGEIAAGARN